MKFIGHENLEYEEKPNMLN